MKLNHILGEHKEGDVIAVYTDTKRSNEIFGWTPQYTIEYIMQTAWAWDQKQV